MAKRTTTNNPIQGSTLRWTFDEGPTKGSTYEHTFHNDGSVEYRSVGGKEKSGKGDSDRPQYGDMQVSDDVHIVSYLSEGGFTLTLALNFDDHQMYGYASNDKEWFPVSGSFEVVRAGRAERLAA
jgi:hypothetical protein